jgi:hypothetical protein
VPDFRATFTSGTVLALWTDPPDGGHRPSRQNASLARGHLRQLGTVGTEVELTATVDGVAGPGDGDGPPSFLGMFAEYVGARPPITSPAGQSSVMRFTPASAGHYCLVFRRDGGGALFLHLDVADE